MYRLKDSINALYKIRKKMKQEKKTYILIGSNEMDGVVVEAYFDVSEMVTPLKGYDVLEINRNYLAQCMRPISMSGKVCILVHTHPTEYENELEETMSDSYLFSTICQIWKQVNGFKMPIICGLMGKEDVILKCCGECSEYDIEYVPKYQIEGKMEYDCEMIYDKYRKFGAIYYRNVGKIKKLSMEKIMVYESWKKRYENHELSQLFETAYITLLVENLEKAEDIKLNWSLNESQKRETILEKVNYNEVQNRVFIVKMNVNQF